MIMPISRSTKANAPLIMAAIQEFVDSLTNEDISYQVVMSSKVSNIKVIQIGGDNHESDIGICVWKNKANNEYIAVSNVYDGESGCWVGTMGGLYEIDEYGQITTA